MAKSKLNKLEPSIKLSITNPKSDTGSVFGKGVCDLCIGVRDTGSLNAAAKNMGMAYSKAWRIIKDTEAALGIDLLVRDGAHGSVLTPDAVKLMDIYDFLCNKLAQEAGKLYKKKTE